MKTNNEHGGETYIAPWAEMIEVTAEKGFAVSPENPTENPGGPVEPF